MEQIAENESVLQSDGNAGEKEVKKKPRIKRKTLREYLFVYGMLLLPLIQFAIFYIWINANSIVMAFQEFDGYADDGGELFKWSFRTEEHTSEHQSQ